MRHPRPAVENPATPEVSCGLGAVNRYSEGALPQTLWGHTGEQFPKALALPCSPLKVFRAQVDELPPHTQPFDCEPASLDRNNRAARHSLTVLQLRSHRDRKSTRLNSSHVRISYAVFCLKKKKNSIKRPAF